jgi:hypothetical protein
VTGRSSSQSPQVVQTVPVGRAGSEEHAADSTRRSGSVARKLTQRRIVERSGLGCDMTFGFIACFGRAREPPLPSQPKSAI